jgi:hypothetical protein
MGYFPLQIGILLLEGYNIVKIIWDNTCLSFLTCGKLPHFKMVKIAIMFPT